MKGALLLTAVLLCGLGVWLVLSIDGGPAPEGTAARPGAPRPGAAPVPTQNVRTPLRVEPEPPSEPQESRVRRPARVERTVETKPERRGASGRVISASGPPVAAAKVALLDGAEVAAEMTTGVGGDFRLAAKAGGELRLRVVAEGFAPHELSLRRLRPGEERPLGNLRLVPSELLKGTVLDAENRPLAGAELSLLAKTGQPPNELRQLAVSGSDGTFRFPSAPRGRLRLVGRAAGHGESQLDHLHDGRSRVTIRLGLSRALVVRFLDPDGRPIPGVNARIISERRTGPEHERATDAEGRVRFDGLGADDWQLRVSSAEHRPLVRRNLRADGHEITLELVPWACVTGRVLTPSGSPPPAGTGVLVLPAGARGDVNRLPDLETTPVAADGSFRVCGVRPGRYVVVAEAPGFAPTRTQPLQVAMSGDTASSAIVLRRGGSLVVRVRGDDGPLGNARVELYGSPPPLHAVWHSNPGLPPVRAVSTDAEGKAALESVGLGQVWFVVRAADHVASLEGPYVIAEGQPTKAAPVRIDRGGRIVGRIVDAEGGPIAGVIVLVARESTERATIQLSTDRDGHFASPPLPDGAWKVRPAGGISGQRQVKDEGQIVNIEGQREVEVRIALP